MAGCKTIIGLKLDSKSNETLMKISSMRQMVDALALLTSAGVFSSIFSKNDLPTLGLQPYSNGLGTLQRSHAGSAWHHSSCHRKGDRVDDFRVSAHE